MRQKRKKVPNVLLCWLQQILENSLPYNLEEAEEQAQTPMAENLNVIPQIPQPTRNLPERPINQTDGRCPIKRLYGPGLQLQQKLSSKWCVRFWREMQMPNGCLQSKMQTL